MIKCLGVKNGKFQIEESEPGLVLKFIGPDANRYEQVNVPTKPLQTVDFSLEVDYIYNEFPGFLPARTN